MSKKSGHMSRFEEVKKLFRKAIEGDRKAVVNAYNLLEAERRSEPDNALFEAYNGSLLALKARDAVKPLEKADLAQAGLDSLQRAVELDPQHKEIRLLRANVCMRLPDSYFRCANTALDDFRLLLSRNQQSPGYLSSKQVEEIKRCIKQLTGRKD